MSDLSFYKNRKVLVTGHTGFKGSWLCFVLNKLGSKVIGYSDKYEKGSLYDLLDLDKYVESYYEDIKDYDALKKCIDSNKPEIIFHLAGQSIVSKGYEDPYDTYMINSFGTLNLLEITRNSDFIRSMVIITTDKVYKDQDKIYDENDILEGYDPYSNSKTLSEHICRTYYDNYLKDKDISLSTVRSANVLGPGDLNINRLIPDCFRAIMNDTSVKIRNRYQIRSYQHVLDVSFFYLMLAESQYFNKDLSSSYNLSDDPDNAINNDQLLTLLKESLKRYDIDLLIEYVDHYFKETDRLILNNSKIKDILSWHNICKTKDIIEDLSKWFYISKNELDLKGFIEEIYEDYLKKYLSKNELE